MSLNLSIIIYSVESGTAMLIPSIGDLLCVVCARACECLRWHLLKGTAGFVHLKKRSASWRAKSLAC